jgi:hypothetical protein
MYFLIFAGDHKSCQLSSLHGGCESRNFYAITSISDLPFTSVVANQGLGVVGKGIGNPLPQIKRVRHSLCGGADGSGGSVSFSQLSDGSSKTLQPELYTEAGRTCTHNSTKMAMMPVFADEPDPYIAPYDGTKGLMGMPFCSFAPNASLKLELPLSQSAESADSVGTLQSAIMSPLMSLSLSSQLLSEADSFGSNASNFLEALMKVLGCTFMSMCMSSFCLLHGTLLASGALKLVVVVLMSSTMVSKLLTSSCSSG